MLRSELITGIQALRHEIEKLDIEQLRRLAYNGCEVQFGK